jgi:predicted secreted protein
MHLAHSPAALALAALMAVAAVQPARAEPMPPGAVNLLTLSATASVEVTRDVLNIGFSTQREGPDAGVVQAQLMQALDAALAEARKIATPGQVEVSTGNFALYPRYAPKGGATQWQGTAELLVEGRDSQAITRLVGRIQTMSVARVGYSLSRQAREKVEAEVSAQAIARFRAKADAYAKEFGFGATSIRAVEVSASDVHSPPMPMFRANMAQAAVAEQALPVEAGKASVSATVSGMVQMK